MGHFYIHHGIAGALVVRQSFGGFGLSGVGSKAGGQDYLFEFVESYSCREAPCDEDLPCLVGASRGA